ncbi:MAG: TldD/PmbA family protein [Myxococcales bacterium]|nr:TldD/PmbA family protein [Myxococcales bacterium]
MLVWLGLLARAEEPDAVMDALRTELDRTTRTLQGEDAPYFLGYRLTESTRFGLDARYGQLSDPVEPAGRRNRQLDVVARVGSPHRDSTHAVRGAFAFDPNIHLGKPLPLDDDPMAMRVEIWNATGKEVRDARERWQRVKANQVVMVADEDPSADFSEVERVVDVRPLASMELDLQAWVPVVTELSAILDDDPQVHRSSVMLDGVATNTWIVTSEGTSIRQPRTWARIALQASSRAEDGTMVRLYRWKDVADPADLPDADTLRVWATDLRDDLLEMREAPSGDAYSGPVLLEGSAAGVFVHEVLGHRVEGHRQKDEDEGHTFRDKVGQRILPPFVDIVDDPTLAEWEGLPLNGHYAYDEEGVPAQRAVLVEDGVFQGFLMSRSPIEGFAQSNGHGRAQPWRQPVSRMANTIVSTSEPHRREELRRMLIAEAKRQGRPFGLIVEDIEGGFTLTGRVYPNAFNVRAVTAWKVYADGRPDERVRNIDLVGTPLVALQNVMALGDDPAVFNGFCGAESGMVPNAAVSPSMLLRTLEVQKKEKDSERPPILPKPVEGGDT